MIKKIKDGKYVEIEEWNVTLTTAIFKTSFGHEKILKIDQDFVKLISNTHEYINNEKQKVI